MVGFCRLGKVEIKSVEYFLREEAATTTTTATAFSDGDDEDEARDVIFPGFKRTHVFRPCPKREL